MRINTELEPAPLIINRLSPDDNFIFFFCIFTTDDLSCINNANEPDSAKRKIVSKSRFF